MPPLILTLKLDEASFRFFDELRRRHFPPERNFLRAHLTLFHHLPDSPAVRERIQALASGTEPFTLSVSRLLFLGRGVAYLLESNLLKQMHKELQQGWWGTLKPQDRQGLRPHVTVQNKVEPPEARALMSELEKDFKPFTATGEGLQLWAYLDGPWELVGEFPFGDTQSGPQAITSTPSQ